MSHRSHHAAATPPVPSGLGSPHSFLSQSSSRHSSPPRRCFPAQQAGVATPCILSCFSRAGCKQQHHQDPVAPSPLLLLRPSSLWFSPSSLMPLPLCTRNNQGWPQLPRRRLHQAQPGDGRIRPPASTPRPARPGAPLLRQVQRRGRLLCLTPSLSHFRHGRLSMQMSRAALFTCDLGSPLRRPHRPLVSSLRRLRPLSFPRAASLLTSPPRRRFAAGAEAVVPSQFVAPPPVPPDPLPAGPSWPDPAACCVLNLPSTSTSPAAADASHV